MKSAHLPHLFEPFGSRILFVSFHLCVQPSDSSSHLLHRCGDDPILEGKGKPDPTIFIVAARLHLGIDTPEGRSKVLVFEDGAPGVRAARAAGMEGALQMRLLSESAPTC